MKIKGITCEDEVDLSRLGSHADAKACFFRQIRQPFQIEDCFVAGEGDDATVIYRFALAPICELPASASRSNASGNARL